MNISNHFHEMLLSVISIEAIHLAFRHLVVVGGDDDGDDLVHPFLLHQGVDRDLNVVCYSNSSFFLVGGLCVCVYVISSMDNKQVNGCGCN